MFGLLRRVSSSLLQRPDRAWNDDATSNAPVAGRKRRLSDADRDEDASSGSKRTRAGPSTVVDEADAARDGSPHPTSSGTPQDPGVKQVTTGVEEVEIGDTPAPAAQENAASEGVEHPAPAASEGVKHPAPATEGAAADETAKKLAGEGAGATLSVPELTPLPSSPAASDVDDDASSSGEEPPASEAAAPDATVEEEQEAKEEEKVTAKEAKAEAQSEAPSGSAAE